MDALSFVSLHLTNQRILAIADLPVHNFAIQRAIQSLPFSAVRSLNLSHSHCWAVFWHLQLLECRRVLARLLLHLSELFDVVGIYAKDLRSLYHDVDVTLLRRLIVRTADGIRPDIH